MKIDASWRFKKDIIKMPFLSAEKFDAMKAQKEEISSWSDIPKGVIYKIEKVKKKTTKYGETTVVHLLDEQGHRIRAWATSMLQKDLEKIGNGVYYIKALDKTESRKNSGQFYYGYELVSVEG